MFKDTLKFAGKLAVVFIAITVFTIIGLTLILGADIDTPYKMLAGAFFILFYVGLLWDNCTRWGEKDCKAVITYVRNHGTQEQLRQAKKQRFHPLKGFFAGAIVMLIPLVLTVAYLFMAYRGWEKEVADVANLIYTILFYVFMAYTPFLVLASPVCTTQAFVFGIPSTSFDNFDVPNMVMPYMFFIPIVVFIVVCGVCYILGYNKRRTEVPAHMQDVYFPKDRKYTPMVQSALDTIEQDTADSSVPAEESALPSGGAEPIVDAQPPVDSKPGEQG